MHIQPTEIECHALKDNFHIKLMQLSPVDTLTQKFARCISLN